MEKVAATQTAGFSTARVRRRDCQSDDGLVTPDE
jgi:hypothetical protein